VVVLGRWSWDSGVLRVGRLQGCMRVALKWLGIQVGLVGWRTEGLECSFSFRCRLRREILRAPWTCVP